jgi:hypothetical protein
LWCSGIAYCDGEDDAAGGEGERKGDEFINRILDMCWPFAEQYGFGGVMGAFTGYALKRVSVELAGIVGLGFVGLQVREFKTLRCVM